MGAVKMGRPAIGPAIQIRLTAEQLAKLDQEARTEGISRAEVIRRLIAKM